MSLWSYLGFSTETRRLVTYYADPSTPEQAVPIGTIPAPPAIDELRFRMDYNPADHECVRETLDADQVIFHWMGGAIDAVCFETYEAAINYPGFADLSRDELVGPFRHFALLFMRGDRIFSEPALDDMDATSSQSSSYEDYTSGHDVFSDRQPPAAHGGERDQPKHHAGFGLRPELILPMFLLLVTAIGLTVSQFPISHAQANPGCTWCGDDPSCLWVNREKCH